MSTTTDAQPQTSLFAIPAPLRSLFKLFPLVTYPPSALPIRSPSSTSASKPRLYIFANASSELSYNPSCLKHQTLLRMAGVDVELVASNNHASPSGALPFILTEGGRPVAAERIGGFVREESGRDLRKGEERRVEAYRALISQAIRPAWLYSLYLNPSNYDLLRHLYLPNNPLLRLPTHQTLTNASTAEILKTTNSTTIQPTHLLTELRSALEALSTLLAEDDRFFGGDEPGTFDAEVFAYTWLMSDEGLGWGEDELGRVLGEFGNLERHRVRVYEECWGSKSG